MPNSRGGFDSPSVSANSEIDGRHAAYSCGSIVPPAAAGINGASAAGAALLTIRSAFDDSGVAAVLARYA